MDQELFRASGGEGQRHVRRQSCVLGTHVWAIVALVYGNEAGRGVRKTTGGRVAAFGRAALCFVRRRAARVAGPPPPPDCWLTNVRARKAAVHPNCGTRAKK